MSDHTKRRITIFLAVLVVAGVIKLVFFPSDEKQILDLMDKAFTLLETEKAEELPEMVRKAKALDKILTDPILVQFNVGRYPKALIQTKRDTVQKFLQVRAHIEMIKIERLNLALEIDSPKAMAKLIVGYTFKTRTDPVTFGDRAHLKLNFKKVSGDWLITEIIQTPFKEDAHLSE